MARLHLDAAVEAELALRASAPPLRVYWNLHPPPLRALGLKSKLKLGAWFAPAFRRAARDARPARHRLRSLRPRRRPPGGARALPRRVPRRMVEAALAPGSTRAPTTPRSRSSDLPDQVRGYEDIKLDSREAVPAAGEGAGREALLKARGAQPDQESTLGRALNGETDS